MTDGTDIEEFSKNAVGKAIKEELSKFDQATILLTIGLAWRISFL